MSQLSSSAHSAAPGDATHRLKGEFAFFSSEQCVYSTGFGPPPILQPLGPVSSDSATLQGTLTLDGKGTGQLVARSVSLGVGTASTLVQQSLRCSVTYRLTGDGAFNLERTCDGTSLRGPGSAGAQLTKYSPVQLSGYLAGNTITAADTRLAGETLTSFWGATTPRLCHRLMSATRIEKIE